MSDDPLWRFLEAADWPAAVRGAERELRDPEWVDRLVQGAANADHTGQDAVAFALRRHAAVLRALQESGADAALRVAAERIDPSEPKDRSAYIQVLAGVSATEPAELTALTERHPWLLSDATDRIIRATVDRFVEESELLSALDGEFRRLLLRAFRRDGSAATLAVVTPAGDATQRSERLHDAVLRARRAGDEEQTLLRMLAWFLGPLREAPAGTVPVAVLNDIGATLMRRHHHTGERADLAFTLLAYQAVHDSLGHAPQRALAAYGLTNLAGAMVTWERATGELTYRDEAIALYRRYLAIAVPEDALRLPSMIALAGLLVAEGRREGRGFDPLDEAEALLAEAVPALAGVDERERLIGLAHLATSGLVRFERTGDPTPARRALDTALQAIRQVPPDTPQRDEVAQELSQLILHTLTTRRDDRLSEAAADLSALATDGASAAAPAEALLHRMQALFNRYESSGASADLHGALDAATQALGGSRPGSTEEIRARTGLGMALRLRFSATGDITDLDEAVTSLRQAVDLQERLDGPPAVPAAYQNLSGALLDRYQQGRQAADLDDAITVSTRLVEGTAAADPLRLNRVSGLAAALRQRYLHRGDRAELDRAIALVSELLGEAPADRPNRTIAMSTLALCLRDRYLADGTAADVTEAARLLRAAVEATPATAPNLEPLLSNYLLVLIAVQDRERTRREEPLDDLYRWMALTHREVTRRIRETGEVPSALASVTGPPERAAVPPETEEPVPPPVDPDGTEDDATPRSLLADPVEVTVPESVAAFAQRATNAVDRFLDAGEQADLDEAADMWRATVRHPAFADLPRPAKQVIALRAAQAAYLMSGHDESITATDRLIGAYELMLSLAEDGTRRAEISYDLCRAWLLRYATSGDETDLDRGYDLVRAAVTVLPSGSETWRRGVRYLAGCLQRYPRREPYPVGRRSRLDQLDALVGEVGPAGAGPSWVAIRLLLLDAYRSVGVDPDQRVDALTRSLRIATDGAAASRAAGDGQSEVFERVAHSARAALDAVAADADAEPVEVTLAELVAGTDDPDEARLRLDRMRLLYQRTDPDDYSTWRYVAMGFAVVLHRATADRADQQDELLEVAAALERNAAAADDHESQGMAVRLQRDVYRERSHGIRADNLDRAVVCAERDLALRAEGTAEWAVSRAELGYALSQRVTGGRPAPGDPARAVRECRAAVAALTAETDPAIRARVHYLLGGVLADSDDGSLAASIEEAIEAYGVALRDQPDGDVDWANSHHQLGLMYTNRLHAGHQENLAVALEHFDQELTVFTRQRHPADWAYAMVSRGNALSQARGADPRRTAAQAAESFEAALTVFTRQAFPQQWARIRASQGLLALDADRVGDRDVDARAALEHLGAALEVYDRERDPVEWARIHEFLTVAELILAGEGQTAHDRRAIEHAELALSVSGLPAVTRARRLANLGAARLELAEAVPEERPAHLDAAARALGEALQIFEQHGLLPAARNVAAGLVETYSWMGRHDRAAEVYERGVAAAERQYAESLLLSSRAAELRDGRRLVQAGVRALVHLGRTAEALVVLERGRARWLGESMDRDRADLSRLADDHPGLADQFRRAAAQVTDAEAAERDGTGDARGAALREQARQARAALAERITRIRRLPGYERFLDLPDLADIARAVRRGSAIAYLLPGEQEGLALIAHRAAGSDLMVSARLLPALTNRNVDRLLRDDGYLAAQFSGGGAELRGLLDPLLDRLGMMLAGAADALREVGCESVTLVPCGRLGVLPVHAAGYRTAGGSGSLLEEFAVAFAPSAWVVAHPAGSVDQPMLAGVGDPTGDLRFAGTELADIADLFPGGDPGRLLYGPAATRAAVLARIPGATHLHLSCHGYYDPAKPDESHLLLAGGDRLTLGELLAGNVLRGVRLAVASACQTAVTDVVRLPDEAIGLPAGFLRAGAAAVVGTLWPVADLPTALLMRRFYQCHLAGDPDLADPAPMAPAPALRAAQLWLAGLTEAELAAYFTGASQPRADDESAPRPFAHPYYWAPFVLAGQ
ncbi:CHAT domain-containing protein [Micromonospora sp. NPDC050495]|uniref:CHAT domain-containing protein n=1 Tax=Micromonospora sp. NPDC050495 TaxID=3154936 RepID=UPI0033DE7D71